MILIIIRHQEKSIAQSLIERSVDEQIIVYSA